MINGRDHLYERFKPLRPDGTVDEARGLVEFVVGTGGEDLRRSPGGRTPGISEKGIELKPMVFEQFNPTVRLTFPPPSQ